MRRRALAGVAFLLGGMGAVADEPKEDEAPAVRLVVPFGVSPGRAEKVTIYGLKLDEAQQARLVPPVAEVKVVAHEKSAPPEGMDAKRYGDTRVVVEFSLPAESARDPLALVVTTPAGETEPIPLRLDLTPPIPEREPNGGFRETQPLELGAVVDGAIERNQDVDVFRVEGQAGGRVIVSVEARDRGSMLDALVSLYDDRGRLLGMAGSDGARGETALGATLPDSGACFAVVQDANDKGSPRHAYRLTARLETGEARAGGE